MLAIIFSLLLISAYVAFRFEAKYAVPVLIAVAHDILITAGVYSLAEREVTSGTVAAFLTILGYSLYDTVIVFDRIRENVPRMPRAAFSQIVNRSMSEVLTRSLITGLSSVFLVTVLLIFGGATLQDFAFAMMVGIVSGTYSSIFIASPVLTAWKEREPGFVRRRERIAAADGTSRPSPTKLELAKLGDDAATDAELEEEAGRPARGRSRCRARWRPAEPPSRRATAASPSTNGEPPAADPAVGRAPRAQRRDAANGASSAASTGGTGDGPGRLVHDGPRALALHRLPARSLLAGDRRRLARRDDRRDGLRRHRPGRPPAKARRDRPGTALLAVPGTAIGLAVVWAIGVRQEPAGLTDVRSLDRASSAAALDLAASVAGRKVRPRHAS